MQKAFQNTAALFLLTFFCLKAGFFPVAPGEPVFPFSGQNAINPLYPPVGDITINFHNTVGGLAHFFTENIKQGSIQNEASEWQSLVLPVKANLTISGLNKILAAAKYISIGLETCLIIFPFHAFW